MKTNASACSSQKQLLVGIDDANGNCGKSMFAKVLADVFDVLAMPLQKTMVYDTTCLGGRNSHGANELAYKTALWVYLDKMQSEQKFNVEALKQLAGGGIQFAARAFHSAKMIKFPWVALVALFCNKGCLPELDSSNKVLLARLRFLRLVRGGLHNTNWCRAAGRVQQIPHQASSGPGA